MRLIFQMGEYRVFISRSSEDAGVAKLLCAWIEKAGALPVMGETHLEGGATFRQSLCCLVPSCNECVVILSPSALNSPWVSWELGLADAEERMVVPFLYEMKKSELSRDERWQALIGDRTAFQFDQVETYYRELVERVARFEERSNAEIDPVGDTELENKISEIVRAMRRKT